MTGWLPAPVEELFGPDTTAEESYEVLTVDVPPTSWLASLEAARDELGCTYFDWLSAVDEPGTGFRVSAHVVALAPVRRLLVRTTVPHDAPVLPSAVEVYAGAAWHERETHEMFGVTFEGHPGLDPLLLPEGFEGHPLRKDFVLAARVAKAWPGAKEPGESEHGGPKRRQMLPPGVPDPNEWGPLKGQLPPAPARPARGTARAAGDRSVRRARTAGEGSASQAAAPGAAAEGAASTGAQPRGAASGGAQAAGAGSGGAQAGAAASGGVQDGGAASAEGAGAAAEARPTARRARSVSEGSATQRRTDSPATEAASPTAAEAAPAPAEGAEETAPAPASPRRARSAGEGSASQRQAPATPATPDAPATPADQSGDGRSAGPARPRSSDAPWHHARPAFDEADQDSATEKPPPTEQPAPEPKSTPESEPTEPAEAPEAESPPSPTDDENPPGGRQ
ncbi:NADH-quinone oxidoreductase subunit C [Streptomyces phaeochromogenes]|uniref:NADH-quinone oxidoreductase subunit C n=1 Tax=Streptomyces phaeochromogenes TaxID=1923 RepID=UPI002DDBF931|nr:NADH-quinone oxidoreductase subunit C [Streptomyces phaeochromogenes]WRZ31674.1 NADH-quinone oxidoreductase subunit C [Streptomyces phaeochromogenes]